MTVPARIPSSNLGKRRARTLPTRGHPLTSGIPMRIAHFIPPPSQKPKGEGAGLRQRAGMSLERRAMGATVSTSSGEEPSDDQHCPEASKDDRARRIGYDPEQGRYRQAGREVNEQPEPPSLSPRLDVGKCQVSRHLADSCRAKFKASRPGQSSRMAPEALVIRCQEHKQKGRAAVRLRASRVPGRAHQVAARATTANPAIPQNR